MTRPIFLLGFALLVAPLGACADDGYGYGIVSSGMSYPYSGYYDGYYGPIYDGYWGSNGYFYYRQNERDTFRRGDHNHFRREGPPPGGNFHPMEGQMRPGEHARMPHFDGRGGTDRPRQDRDRRDR